MIISDFYWGYRSKVGQRSPKPPIQVRVLVPPQLTQNTRQDAGVLLLFLRYSEIIKRLFVGVVVHLQERKYGNGIMTPIR